MNEATEHIISSTSELIKFVRDGSNWLCMNDLCNSHCETFFNEKTNYRHFKTGFKMQLNKLQIKQFNKSKYCRICANIFDKIEYAGKKVNAL